MFSNYQKESEKKNNLINKKNHKSTIYIYYIYISLYKHFYVVCLTNEQIYRIDAHKSEKYSKKNQTSVVKSSRYIQYTIHICHLNDR